MRRNRPFPAEATRPAAPAFSARLFADRASRIASLTRPNPLEFQKHITCQLNGVYKGPVRAHSDAMREDLRCDKH